MIEIILNHFRWLFNIYNNLITFYTSFNKPVKSNKTIMFFIDQNKVLLTN